MTFDETRDILTLLQCEYPQSFSRLDMRQIAAKINLWADEFANDDYEAVYAAVRTIIRTGGREFAPNIGVIRDTMYQLGADGQLDESQAWALVAKACRDGYYRSKEVFDALPPEVQIAVGTPEQIRTWGMLEESEFETVIGSHFRKAYRIAVARKRSRDLLPENIRKLSMSIAEKMMIGGPEDHDYPRGVEGN